MVDSGDEQGQTSTEGAVESGAVVTDAAGNGGEMMSQGTPPPIGNGLRLKASRQQQDAAQNPQPTEQTDTIIDVEHQGRHQGRHLHVAPAQPGRPSPSPSSRRLLLAARGKEQQRRSPTSITTGGRHLTTAGGNRISLAQRSLMNRERVHMAKRDGLVSGTVSEPSSPTFWSNG